MQVPFDGFVVPPLPYAVLLVSAAAIVVAILYAIRPPITQMGVLSLVPWMVSGAALHVFYQLGTVAPEQVYPPLIEPLFSAPAVYLSTFVAMGVIWILASIVGTTTRSEAEGKDYVAQYLGATGIGVMVSLIALVVWQGLGPGAAFEPIVPLAGFLLTLALTFVIYILLGTWRTYIIAEARYVGALVLFAHLLDGVTTAIGVDIFGTGERSVIPARIIEFAADLPTAQYIGSGWLFVVVKMLVAVFIVVAFADYVREKPDQGNLLFAFVTAVGLGPAMNNIFLFTLGVGV